jgi:hypothetical protein
MTSTCRSLHSWVTAPPPNPTGGIEWPRGTSVGCNPYVGFSHGLGGGGWGVDQRRPSADLFQPLHLWVMTMRMYSGPSCPDRSFSKELDETEINTRIHRVLALGDDLNLRASTAPLMEGVNNTWVSLLKHILDCLCQSWFLNAFLFLCRVLGVLVSPLGESTYPRM